MIKRIRFPQYAWGLLAYNIAVILWGAVVRATGSGAGCGAHWPLCDGTIIPYAKSVQLLIEFAHRASSGLVLLLVAVLMVWAYRAYPPGHRVRQGAIFAMGFTLSEALIGAALVLFKLVAKNDSAYRAIAISAHLTNTFLLLACLTLTAYWASGGPPLRPKGQGVIGWALGLALLGVALLGVSGAVNALGDTLFPVGSLAEGLRQDVNPTAHFLIHLRFLHPLIAVSVGLYILLIVGLVAYLRPVPQVRYLAQGVGTMFVIQLGLGLTNMLLLAPVWMQLIHLLSADLLWIMLVLMTASALAEGIPQVELVTMGSPGDSPDLSVHGAVGWRDYIALTKPRVISLLLFTTLAAMFIAADASHHVTLPMFIAVAIGGYMAAGAANAINMVIDRDIDGRMKRTASRPTVTQKIPSRRALRFGLLMMAASFALLWIGANLLTAMLALAGLVFYVIVYTLVLKRRTWQNIVIGGAAGAFPPLVGWAAVTGNLSPLAWCLFAIIFVWTPVHFWALALLLKDDYALAGVPMLPVVRGERVTVIQIGLYAILTAVISILPLLQREVHGIYLVAALVLNGLLLLRCLQLYREPVRPRASSLFHYSMVYLALLFLMMAIDRAVGA